MKMNGAVPMKMHNAVVSESKYYLIPLIVAAELIVNMDGVAMPVVDSANNGQMHTQQV